MDRLLLMDVLVGISIIGFVITVILLAPGSYSSAPASGIYFSSFLRATIGIAFLLLVTMIIMTITGWNPVIF